jgi:hypothetical protein
VVAVVQTQNGVGAGSPTTLNFTSNASVGNSVIVWIGDYNTSSSVISSSAPTYNGASVTGAIQLIAVQNTGTDVMYFSVWLLPNIQSAGTSVAISTTNANADGNSHYYIAEVSGLGANPVKDTASPNPATASNNAGSTTPSSGATGNAVGSSGIVLGGMMQDGNNSGWTGPSGWTTIAGSPNSYAGASYQIFTSSGANYTWSTTLATSGQWSAGAVILDVTAVTAGNAPGPLLIPPGLQSPMVLAEPPVFAVSPAPQQQPGPVPQLIPPGLLSPMTLAVPVTPATQAPPPVPPSPPVLLTPPGLASPMALAVAGRPATSAPPVPPPVAVPGTMLLVPPGRLSPMALAVPLYFPPSGSAQPGPVPAPSPALLPPNMAFAYDGKGWLKKQWILGL